MIKFLQLVLKGYWYEQNYFPEYLIRELKKAETENYEAKEFFSRCFDVVEGFQKELDRKKFEEKNFIFNALNNYKEPEKHQDEIARGYQDMKNLSRKDFSVDLFNYTNGEILGTLYYDDLFELEFLIFEAIKKYDLEINFEPLISKYRKTKDFYLILPFKTPSINKDNFRKWEMLLQYSLQRFIHFLKHLPAQDQIKLKSDFSTFLDWIGEGKSNDYKTLFLSYLKLIQEEFEKIKGKPVIKSKTTFETFFNEEVNPEVITSIQKKFKDLEIGKEMAVLIYLLHKKYSLIYLDNNQRNKKSRIHFVRALTGTEIKTINGINNFFEPITAEITVNEKDEVFLKINDQLKEMVSTG